MGLHVKAEQRRAAEQAARARTNLNTPRAGWSLFFGGMLGKFGGRNQMGFALAAFATSFALRLAWLVIEALWLALRAA